jgi:hypothetical protein
LGGVLDSAGEKGAGNKSRRRTNFGRKREGRRDGNKTKTRIMECGLR